MSERVTLPTVESMSPEQAAVYERFQSNLTRALLLTKNSAGAHLALGATFTVGLLSDLLREVIVLRVAALRDSEFERALHYPLALAAGLSADEIDTIENGRCDEMPADRAALVRYVDDCIMWHKAGDEAFWGLHEYFTENEIAETTHLAGHAAMTAMFLASLEIPLDEKLASWSRLTELQR